MRTVCSRLYRQINGTERKKYLGAYAPCFLPLAFRVVTLSLALTLAPSSKNGHELCDTLL